MPESSYPFPMYSGLLEPEHYQRIGPAIWLFLWCVSSTTAEKEIDGTVWGIVLGNKPMKLPEISQKFGVNVKTVSRWLDTLEENHYIKVTRAPHGLILSVKNSKKWTDKNVRSEHSEQTNLSDQGNVDQTDMSDQQDKIVRSNKDITEINNAAAIRDPETILKLAHEVEKHFCMRRGQGFNVTSTDFDEIKQLVATGIPIEIVKQSIDKSFAEYKPKHRWDKIRNMAYCIPRCLDEWIKTKVDDSITGAVPHVPVALGSSLPQMGAYRGGRKQAQKSNLQRIAEEEEAKHAQG